MSVAIPLFTEPDVSTLTLTLAKFSFLALLYLFVLMTLRVIIRELRESVEPAGASPDRDLKQILQLLVLEPKTQNDYRIPLAHNMTFGRADSCDIKLDDQWMSSYHACVTARGDDFFIEDAGSTNGTYVNRQRIHTPTRIRRGDTIQVGRTVMEVVK